MAGKPADNERMREARKVLERVERDSEVVGTSSFVRTAGKVRDHLAAAEADQEDRVEVWARRSARIASAIAFVALAFWLVQWLAR